MGKRSNFDKIERDFYPTPEKAVRPLLHFIEQGATYVEPCAGRGDLIQHLDSRGYRCTFRSDIKGVPELSIAELDANKLVAEHCEGADFIITNPPWSKDVLVPLANHLRSLRPTLLLLNADVMHNKYMSKLMEHCAAIVSVGRVKWIPDSPHTGKENCAWFLFTKEASRPFFYGR